MRESAAVPVLAVASLEERTGRLGRSGGRGRKGYIGPCSSSSSSRGVLESAGGAEAARSGEKEGADVASTCRAVRARCSGALGVGLSVGRGMDMAMGCGGAVGVGVDHRGRGRDGDGDRGGRAIASREIRGHLRGVLGTHAAGRDAGVDPAHAAAAAVLEAVAAGAVAALGEPELLRVRG
jgi:hypothetical protein